MTTGKQPETSGGQSKTSTNHTVVDDFERTPWLRSTVVRLTVGYLVAYGAMIGVALAAMAWISGQSVKETDAQLLRDAATMISAMPNKARAQFLNQPEPSPQTAIGGLFAPTGDRRAGVVYQWPDSDELPAEGVVGRMWHEDEAVPLLEDETILPTLWQTLETGDRLLLILPTSMRSRVADITETLVDVLPSVLLLSLLLTISVNWTLRRRISTISRTAAQIVSGDIGQRIPYSGRNDEFDALSRQLNTMLDRIERLIRGMRQVTDNVAHDLRHPITRLRTSMEVSLLEPRSAGEYESVIRDGIEQTDDLIKTFNELLSIAQAEAGNHRSQWAAFDITELVGRVAELYEGTVDDNDQSLNISGVGAAYVLGSSRLIAQALSNVLDNALKYTPAGGEINIHVSHDGDRVRISIADNGPGIDEQYHDCVFDRFTRLDLARSKPGNGLGLSLVKAVAELHRAGLSLASNHPGLIVTLDFKRVAAPAVM